MAVVERGGYIQATAIGIGAFSNLKCPTRPYVSVRFKILGHIGLRIPAEYVGGSMTWDELATVGLPWGNNETVIYPALEPGWTYILNPGKKTFTVTDALGNVTVHQNITTFSDLGIVWDILESPQFKIVFDASFEDNAFLLAWRYIHGFIPDGPGSDDPRFPEQRTEKMEYCWALVDAYLNQEPVDASKIERFFWPGENIAPVEDNLTSYIDGTEIAKANTVLLARVADLSAYGSYPSNFYKGMNAAVAAQDMRNKAAHSWEMGTLLMIAAFASIMNASKPVFEPWMLWKMWQWVGASSVVVTRDRCFDLSPWWG